MSDYNVVLLPSNLEEILKKGGTPLEDLPLSAAKKHALRAEADAIKLNPGGTSGGGWVCFQVTPGTAICHFVPPTLSPI